MFPDGSELDMSRRMLIEDSHGNYVPVPKELVKKMRFEYVGEYDDIFDELRVTYPVSVEFELRRLGL